MIRKVDLTGDYETTVYDAARRLLVGGADPAGTVETWRDGKLSMSGVIGELAKWRVAFRGSGPCLVPYAASTLAVLAAETAVPVHSGHLRPRGHPMTAPHRRRSTDGASLQLHNKPRPWRAKIYLAGRQVSLGYYASPEEARAAHAAAVQEHLGERYLKSGAEP
jgi:hypothetical protein